MKRHLDLMTGQAARNAEFRNAVRFWTIGLLALALVAAPTTFYFWRQNSELNSRRKSMEVRCEPVRQMRRHDVLLRSRRKQLIEDHQFLLELSQARPVTTLLARVAEASAATGGQLSVVEIVVDPLRAEVGDPEKGEGRIVLQTISVPEYQVEQFAAALRKTPVTSVKVTQTAITHDPHQPLKACSVECRF